MYSYCPVIFFILFYSSVSLDSLHQTYMYCMHMYRCELWNLSCSYVNKYIVAWRKIKRRLWRLPYTTHNNIVHNLCNDVALRIVSFIHNNYNLYFVHNTISTPYFHRQRNSTNKLHRKIFFLINYDCKQITAINIMIILYTILI